MPVYLSCPPSLSSFFFLFFLLIHFPLSHILRSWDEFKFNFKINLIFPSLLKMLVSQSWFYLFPGCGFSNKLYSGISTISMVCDLLLTYRLFMKSVFDISGIQPQRWYDIHFVLKGYFVFFCDQIAIISTMYLDILLYILIHQYWENIFTLYFRKKINK